MVTQKPKEPITKTQEQEGQSKGENVGKIVIISLIVTLLVVLPALGTWYWQSTNAKREQAVLQKKIDQLTMDKQALEEAAKKTQSAKVAAAPVCPSLTSTQINNIHAAIESGNTAALDSLMTSSVSFDAAASGKTGSETKVAAISDLSSFLVGVNASWDWNITSPTLAAYKNGSYKLYLADDTIYGASIDKHFISMRVTCGKIDQIFVAANTDLLP